MIDWQDCSLVGAARNRRLAPTSEMKPSNKASLGESLPEHWRRHRPKSEAPEPITEEGVRVVTARIQRRHSSFAQEPQLDMRPLSCYEMAFLGEESFPTFEHSTSMGDEQGQSPYPHQSERHGDTAAFFNLIKHFPPQTLPALICRLLHHFSSSRSSRVS